MITKDDKVAVLVCGEYRTFDVAVAPTWKKFNKLPNFNLYFSTWNHSYQGNDLLDIHYRQDITEDSIKMYFDKNVYVNIMNLETELSGENISHSKYLLGADLAMSIHLQNLLTKITSDETEWDYIIITRPDLLISNIDTNFTFNNDIIYTPINSIMKEIICDTFFMGKRDVMFDFIKHIIKTHSYEHAKIKELQINKTFQFEELPTIETQIIRPNSRNHIGKYDKLSMRLAQTLFNEYDLEKSQIWNGE